MQVSIDPKCLADMASSLENDELGSAIRLLNRIIATGKHVPLSRARTVCQMDEQRWLESSDEILSHFTLDKERIGHRVLDEARIPTVSSAPAARSGTTGEMPIVHVTKNNSVPSYASRDKPEIISMKKTAYKLMVDIFARSDQSENTARVLLTSLLKNWPEGDVYEAITAADRQKYLVDPRGWLIRHLQRSSQPIVAARSRKETCPPPQRKSAPRALVTPEAMGVSNTTAERIRQKNKGLRLELPSRKQDA